MQFNSQSSSISSQAGIGLGQVQVPESGHTKSEEQQQSFAEDVSVESVATAGANKHMSEDDTKIPFSV
jgi:hypothetical protein